MKINFQPGVPAAAGIVNCPICCMYFRLPDVGGCVNTWKLFLLLLIHPLEEKAVFELR